VGVGSLGCHGQSLPEIERELKTLSQSFYELGPLEPKLTQNKKFTQLLKKVLQTEEGFTYPFDSLETVSHLYAEDNTFRIFTWQIIDRSKEKEPGEYYHYYFGLVQRRWINPQGDTEWVVIPLIELPKISLDIENRVLDNRGWLGGLYYPPRFGEKIAKRVIKFLDLETGKKVKQTAYLLFGWNGFDASSNIKFVDILTLDPNDKNRIYFGANIFFFDIVAKYRAVFRYSDNAPFNLNYGYVKSGLFDLFKKKMIVYDHLSSPDQGRSFGGWSMGPDGSYDALEFRKQGGYYEWLRDVDLASKFDNKMTKKYQATEKEKARKELEEAGIYLQNNP